jgi:hypothetical protein
MEKELFKLSIEEFTRLLLDYEKVYEMELKSYKEDGKTDVDTIKGTYSQLYDITMGYKDFHQNIINKLFDYNMQLSNLDVYNYLDYITNNFQKERVRIVINEMEVFYEMEYCEDIDNQVLDVYHKNGWEVPTMQCEIRNNIEITPLYEKMREKVFPFRDYLFRRTLSLLYSKIGKVTKIGIYVSAEKKHFKKIFDTDNLKLLMGLLKDSGYISPETKEGSFLYWFGTGETPNDLKPIIWMKKNSKTRTPSKVSLLDLLSLIGYKENEVRNNINAAFQIEGGKKFTPQDYTQHKDFSKIESEYHNDITSILEKIKK